MDDGREIQKELANLMLTFDALGDTRCASKTLASKAEVNQR